LVHFVIPFQLSHEHLGFLLTRHISILIFQLLLLFSH
jgi:hypothetical protein